MRREELIRFKQHLEENDIKGIALDIDETICDTLRVWFTELFKFEENIENLTVDQMLAKYKSFSEIEYLQTGRALQWVQNAINTDSYQETLPVLDGAQEHVAKLNDLIPVVVYLTVRPEGVINGTRNWLKKNGFPDAQVFCLPDEADRSKRTEWKAETLEFLWPNVVGIIDDSNALAEKVSPEYQGTIFHFNGNGYHTDKPFVIDCKDWAEVYSEALKLYN